MKESEYKNLFLNTYIGQTKNITLLIDANTGNIIFEAWGKLSKKQMIKDYLNLKNESN